MYALRHFPLLVSPFLPLAISAILPDIPSVWGSVSTEAIVTVRLPPTLDPKANTADYTRFTLPSPSWFGGNWKITRSSSKTYQGLINFQFDSYLVVPACPLPSPSDCAPGTFPGQLVDLTSFNAPNDASNKIITSFGYDTPRRLNELDLGPGFDGVYDFKGNGLFNATENSWQIMSWGTDDAGDEYFVLYETPASGDAPQDAAITIESRSETGPTDRYTNAIKRRVKALGNDDLSAMIDDMGVVKVDGRRTGQPAVVCDAKCQINEGLFPVKSGVGSK